jgi:hypothetical protein
MLDLASFYVGITEATGQNDGPIIERFQKAVDGKAQGEPYCMGFLQFCALETAEAHGGRVLAVRSESVLAVWNQTPTVYRKRIPAPGRWALWQHGESWAGHAGIVRSVGPDWIETVEANTSPGGTTIVREGEGVYIRRRSLKPVGTMRLLGFLQVFD